MSTVLGISAYFHDAAAALVVDGQIIAAAQEERFSRIKHDARLPVQAAQFCLAQAGLEIDAIDHVVFYEKPLRKFERLLVSSLREFPKGLSQFGRAMSTWLGKRLWLSGDLCKTLGCAPQQLLFSEHHLSHAAAAFLTSPYEDAAILTVDGVGEWATTSIFHGRTDSRGTHIELLRELHFPHSIGLLYSALTAFLGFEVNEGEYKVMGLAAYGQDRYRDIFAKLCTVSEDGALVLDRRYFSFQHHATKSFTKAMEELLGPARAPGAPLDFKTPTPDSQRFADIAASLQRFTERYLLALSQEAHRLTGASQLCLGGGVALNSVANRYLADHGPFAELFVHPAAGDAGGALGAALYVSHVVHGEPRSNAPSPALGQAFDKNDIHQFIHDCHIPHERYEDPQTLANAVAERLVKQEVGGWFQGRFEWGPRALGHRSIVADPRGADTKDRVNRKIKFREGFRPFAPAVLQEDAAQWFDLGTGRDRALWPYMCSVAPATAQARELLPAVVHVDGTARLQTVDEASHPGFHALISAFKKRTGIGVLLNTSMNLKDEPICGSPAEAYGTFVRSGLDFLVLENCIVTSKEAA